MSIETRHTPGPWRVGRTHGAVVTDVEHPGVWSDEENKQGYGGFLVCESVRSQANANLIAAAPDLLAALKKTRTQAYGAIVASGSDPEYAAIAVSDADAAIAKAEGAAC